MLVRCVWALKERIPIAQFPSVESLSFSVLGRVSGKRGSLQLADARDVPPSPVFL